jgi:hypothetical protein
LTLACFSNFFSFRRRTRALKLKGDVDRVTFPEGRGSGTVSDEKLPPPGVAVPGDDPSEQVDPPDPDLSSLNRFAGTGSGEVDPVDPADDQGDRFSIDFLRRSSVVDDILKNLFFSVDIRLFFLLNCRH